MRKWRGLTDLETSVESQCDAMMRQLGWKIVKFSFTKRRAIRQTKGIPDRKYYRGSDTFWFEAKSEDGVQSADQRAFQEMCEKAGELYVLGGKKELERFLTLDLLEA